jgi:hypothetical protein
MNPMQIMNSPNFFLAQTPGDKETVSSAILLQVGSRKQMLSTLVRILHPQ